MKRSSEQAVALVITLIMLSVITIVAVAFLALAMRDRSAATTVDKLTRAQTMADAARERAIAEIGAQIIDGYNNGVTSLMAFDMLVSHTDGFNAGNNPAAGVTNIRPGQVEADTNLTFLDLNRNGIYDRPVPGNEDTEPGDPEWIAVSDQPAPLSEENHYLGRYAFVVQPVGKALDLNFSNNQAKQANPGAEGYIRRYGLGSWELNLAAFLVDLNTNSWPPPTAANPAYDYIPDQLTPSGGAAFEDAFDLLSFRYAPDFTALADAPPPLAELGEITNHWAGSYNYRHYYDFSELFDTNRVYTNFVNTLRATMDYTNAYDAQTLYRLMAQMGMDSVPQRPKINLNYINIAIESNQLTGVITNYAPTNLEQNGVYEPWSDDPDLFFLTVARRLFEEYKFPGVIVTETNFVIQISPTNYYTPAVQRVLQLTANLYDATQEGAQPARGVAASAYAFYFPTVFRPLFTNNFNGLNGLFIDAYVEANGRSLIRKLLAPGKWHDLNDDSYNLSPVRRDDFIYGIPLIIGAKKGFPNFNEFTSEIELAVARKLLLFKRTPDQPPFQTNQMYFLSIANRIGAELWNSYAAPLPYPLRVKLKSDVRTTLYDGITPVTLANSRTNIDVPVFDTNWVAHQFITVLSTNNPIQPFLPYKFDPSPRFVYSAETETNGFPVPDWNLSVTNRVLCLLYYPDPGNERLIDMVALADLSQSTNVMKALMEDTPYGVDLWNTNRTGTSVFGPTDGIQEQMDISLGAKSISPVIWRELNSAINDKTRAVQDFQQWIGATNATDRRLIVQPGFNPARRVYLTTSWQANDPLLHSMLWDLLDETNTTRIDAGSYWQGRRFPDAAYHNLGIVNTRYRPWPKTIADVGSHRNPFDLSVQDPLVRSSDDWDFPEYRLANVGWLGQVHRGTPWQTVYLKAEVAPEDKWLEQTRIAYMPETHPTNDWCLVDLFTVAPTANSTRGTLSINQKNQAAWSAVLSGIDVLARTTPNSSLEPSPNEPVSVLNNSGFFPTNLIQPASLELSNIVAGINRVRASRPGERFNRLSEILAVPELSVDRRQLDNGRPRSSPFLALINPAPDYDVEQRVGISDAAYEFLPMQILSLLRVGEPRVVIYAYGQSLEPYGSRYMDSFGVPTNYRVTAEYATRSVVRFEIANVSTNGGIQLRPVIESFNILPQ